MNTFASECERASAFKRAAGPFAQAIFVKTPQGDFAVPVEDLYVGWQLRFEGRYGEGELNYLRKLCSDSTRLLVVGAHIGALTIPLAKLCRSVVAVEANPHNFELLQLNVMLNGLNNCKLICRAASNRAESLDFLLNRVNSGGSKRNPMENWLYFFDSPEVVKVEASRLDDLLPQEVFDLVVMDIEGSEYFALQGMQRILAYASTLQVEFLPHHLKNVAGVSAADFAATIAPHFSSMLIVRKDLVVGRDRFVSTLSEMFARNEEDDGLIFSKTPPELVRIPE